MTLTHDSTLAVETGVDALIAVADIKSSATLTSARARRGEGRGAKHPAADRPHIPDAFIQRPRLARGGVRGAGHQLIYDASQRRNSTS